MKAGFGVGFGLGFRRSGDVGMLVDRVDDGFGRRRAKARRSGYRYSLPNSGEEIAGRTGAPWLGIGVRIVFHHFIQERSLGLLWLITEVKFKPSNEKRPMSTDDEIIVVIRCPAQILQPRRAGIYDS